MFPTSTACWMGAHVACTIRPCACCCHPIIRRTFPAASPAAERSAPAAPTAAGDATKGVGLAAPFVVVNDDLRPLGVNGASTGKPEGSSRLTPRPDPRTHLEAARG